MVDKSADQKPAEKLTSMVMADAFSQRALESLPAEFLVSMGRDQLLHGNRNLAMRYVNWALHADIECKDAWIYRGEIFADQGKLEDACNCFDHALEIDSKLAEIWFEEGEVFLRRERPDRAILCFRESRRISHEYDSVCFDTLYTKGKECYFQQNPEDASAYLKEALHINPVHFGALIHAAKIAIVLHRPKAALEYSRYATNIAPESEVPFKIRQSAFVLIRKDDVSQSDGEEF